MNICFLQILLFGCRGSPGEICGIYTEHCVCTTFTQNCFSRRWKNNHDRYANNSLIFFLWMKWIIAYIIYLLARLARRFHYFKTVWYLSSHANTVNKLCFVRRSNNFTDGEIILFNTEKLASYIIHYRCRYSQKFGAFTKPTGLC